MYSDPAHIQFTESARLVELDLPEDCLEKALLNEEPLDVCFGIGGIPLCYWKDIINTECCNRLLVIDADYLMAAQVKAIDLIEAIRKMVRNCPDLRHIRIGGSQQAMANHFKLVTNSGRRSAPFAAYIQGINVLKGYSAPHLTALEKHRSLPLVVSTMTKLGSGPSSKVVWYRYV
jgi:hypothetical protein